MDMRILINTDLEGICCFVDWDEANIHTGRGIGYTKEFLTAEVNAAISGILQETPEAEIVVLDGHGGGWWGPNIIAEHLHPRAGLILGKRSHELEGLTSDTDLFIAIGAHAMAGTRYGCMNHTLSSETIMNIWVNDVLVGEIGLWAALAGSFGVPFGMVSGDYWAVKEAEALLGTVIGVAVKRGLNRLTAVCMHPDEARTQIAQAARQAVAERNAFKPYIVRAPAVLKVEYTNTTHADRAENGGAERLDGRTVCYTGGDFLETFAKFR
jgi:D-amino peptidase